MIYAISKPLQDFDTSIQPTSGCYNFSLIRHLRLVFRRRLCHFRYFRYFRYLRGGRSLNTSCLITGFLNPLSWISNISPSVGISYQRLNCARIALTTKNMRLFKISFSTICQNILQIDRQKSQISPIWWQSGSGRVWGQILWFRTLGETPQGLADQMS